MPEEEQVIDGITVRLIPGYSTQWISRDGQVWSGNYRGNQQVGWLTPRVSTTGRVTLPLKTPVGFRKTWHVPDLIERTYPTEE